MPVMHLILLIIQAATALSAVEGTALMIMAAVPEARLIAADSLAVYPAALAPLCKEHQIKIIPPLNPDIQVRYQAWTPPPLIIITVAMVVAMVVVVAAKNAVVAFTKHKAAV